MERDERNDRTARSWRRLAIAAAVGTYILIVLGGIVRVTGSGMGCGDDWPLCNGELFPPMDLPTFIEWGHRLVAAGVSVLVAGLAVYGAWLRHRGRLEGLRVGRLGALAVALLVLQILLGAVTVWLELPPTSVILHLGTAMALLAVLVVGVCRAYGRSRLPRRPDAAGRVTWGVAGFGLVVVLAGALVANLDAAPACQGFPLCNGRWLPAGPWRIHLHWWHRALAYGLALGVLFLPAAARRWRPSDPAARRAAWWAAGLVLAQLGVAAAMILGGLPIGLQALHAAVGAAVFAALVVHAWIVSHPPVRRAEPPAGRREAGRSPVPTPA